MEAKDTVMDESTLHKVAQRTMMDKYPAQLKAIAEIQAEITAPIFEKIGMQRVVNFINKCYSFPIRPADGIQYWDTWIPREKWKAFLKENGLER